MTQVPWFISNAWMIPLVPAMAFLGIVLFTRRYRYVSAGLSILAMAVSSALSTGVFLDLVKLAPADRTVSLSWAWISLPPWEAKVGILVDPLSVNMLLVVCLVSLLVQVYSLGYMRDDERFSVYFSYLSLFSASMLGLTLSNNYLQIFLCWEWVAVFGVLLFACGALALGYLKFDWLKAILLWLQRRA